MLTSIFFAFAAAAPTAANEEPIRVLLLDYNAPDEHDVLVSHLCVDPCRRELGCPDELIRDGVDAWSEDFIVYRPPYLGASARFVAEAFANRNVDLLSFSGHHASGFTGDLGHGRFDTERLAEDLEGTLVAEPFFTHPAMVLLQGCRTDVKSQFTGDPLEYVLHVIEETRVREDEFERVMAAIQQIGGVQQAYRDLFPNACLLGYAGTQAPGGRLEIYAQIHSLLRNLVPEARRPAKKIALTARSSDDDARRINRQVEEECRQGWPCNLCDQDSTTYRPLASNLGKLLRQERQRIHEEGKSRPAEQRRQLEALLESSSFYANTRWSCSAEVPGRPPVWPDPVEDSPFGHLFLELLFLDFANLPASQRTLLRAELVHRLGRIAFTENDRATLGTWLRQEPNADRLRTFQGLPLLHLSTFRQQDFFRFLANLGCADCFRQALAPEQPSILRENAVRNLRPILGAEPYLRALDDPDRRIRYLAAQTLGPDSPLEARRRAFTDPDPVLRDLAAAALAGDLFLTKYESPLFFFFPEHPP